MTESQWEAVKNEMVPVMSRTAANEDTISYSDLMKQVTTVRIGPDDPAVGSLLGQISEDEDAAGRGMLSVVVVHKTGDKMPGPGFFALAETLGRDTSDTVECWVSELNWVHKYWRSAT